MFFGSRLHIYSFIILELFFKKYKYKTVSFVLNLFYIYWFYALLDLTVLHFMIVDLLVS